MASIPSAAVVGGGRFGSMALETVEEGRPRGRIWEMSRLVVSVAEDDGDDDVLVGPWLVGSFWCRLVEVEKERELEPPPFSGDDEELEMDSCFLSESFMTCGRLSWAVLSSLRTWKEGVDRSAKAQ